ncbi:MAG: glycosyltransferase, partial [Clostridia bacterium]|nr:glycosyltransferase [Clostridia bacterium]
MKLTFVSNALTPHQIPFCEACINILGDGFSFVSVAEVTDERKTIGWGAEAKDYEIRSYESSEAREKAITSINEADVLILGSASEDIIKSRLKAKKLTFKYSERQYKKPLNIKTYPHALAGAWLHFGRYQSAPFYLLCASAYASADFMKFGNFKNRAFKWGYFPATYEYDIDVLMAKKESRTITWAARMIDWKHPELAVEMARRLKADGIDFTLNVIGFGVMENEIRESVARLGLADCVKLLGSMKPEEVREYMEKSAVFLMTSDRQEGWGAVLNEAQNSACAVLANSAAGSAPYLIKNGENGFIYNEKDI